MLECKCPVCGRRFYPQGEEWLYKLTINKKTVYYCRYNCWRKVQTELEHKKAVKKGCKKSDH